MYGLVNSVVYLFLLDVEFPDIVLDVCDGKVYLFRRSLLFSIPICWLGQIKVC